MLGENFKGSRKPYCLCMNYQNFHCCCTKLVLWKNRNILCGLVLTTALFCLMITTGWRRGFYSLRLSWNVSDNFALNWVYCAGLFIIPSGNSELDCATTKTDTAEKSVSIVRESLQVLFVLGALVYFQVPPLGGSREEKWRSQWIRKRSVSWNLPNLSQLWLCNGGFGSCTTQEPPTDKTIREWYMNSSIVAACALRYEQAVRAHRPAVCKCVLYFCHRVSTQLQ